MKEDGTCTLPSVGKEWYTLCGTPYIDPRSGRDTSSEYVMVVVGTCLVAMCLFTQIYHYPRTLFDVIRNCEVPKYYKVKAQNNQKILKQIYNHKIDTTNGEELYQVEHVGSNESDSVDSENNRKWIRKEKLVSDGMGPVYGERGGLYGWHGVNHETSTRERLRTFDSYGHALERLQRPLSGNRMGTVKGLTMEEEEEEVVVTKKKKSLKKKSTRAKSKTSTRRSTRSRR